MNAQDLRNSILQLAVQGQLVEQRPEEGTAKELLGQIRAEKQRLIKEKKIKREQPLPNIAEEEIPFEIPESWEWVRVADIFNVKSAMRIHQTDWQNEGVPFFRGRELVQLIKTGRADFEIFISQELYERNKQKGGVPQKNDILVTAVGTIGKSYIVQGTKPFYYKDAYILCFGNIGNIYPDYIKWCLDSPYMQNEIHRDSMATTVAQLTIIKAKGLLIPFPPLAEQKRIVAKIEEVLPYIEQYDKAHTKLEVWGKKFPEDMKKSILQLAMQGKLVEQRPEEGTADELYKQIEAEKARLVKAGKIKAEKPLSEIGEEEIPFEIPKSWKWVRLNSIATAIADGDHQPPPQVEIGVPFLVISNISQGMLSFINTRNVPQEYYDNIQDVRKPQNGDVLFSVTGSYGLVIPIETDEAFCVQRHIAIIKKPFVSVDYLVKCLSAPHFYKQCTEKATGTAQKTVGLEVLRNLILPLPPLAEQKRIAAKIEEISPYCERLMK